MRERESNTDVGRFGWTSRTGEGSGQPPRTETVERLTAGSLEHH